MAIDRYDVDAAKHHLRESGARVGRTGRRAMAAFQRLLHIELVAARSGPAVALAELEVSTLSALEPAMVIDLTRAQQLRFLVADGQLAKGSYRARSQMTGSSELTAPTIDLELAAGRVEAARHALDHWVVPPADVRTTVKFSLREAAVLQAEGHPVPAAAALRVALELAEPERLRRPFLDQPAVTSLLQPEAQRASRAFARSILARVLGPGDVVPPLRRDFQIHSPIVSARCSTTCRRVSRTRRSPPRCTFRSTR